MQIENFRNSPAGRVLKTPAGFYAFVPHPLPPDLTWYQELVVTLSAADRAVGELAGLGRTLPNPRLLIRPFMRREAVLSSRIEGTQASLNDLIAYDVIPQLTHFEFPSDVQEVKNYVLALEYGLERLATLPISLRLLREVHSRLMQGVRGSEKMPGEFRRGPNWIGPPGSTVETAVYVPPPVDEMQGALDAFEHYLNMPSRLPPLVRLGLIHLQFEAIHPFMDGNGRVGRLLLVLLMCAWELLPQPLLYLSAYFEKFRQIYYDLLLDVMQRGVWEAWLVFFLNGVVEQSLDASSRIQRMQNLHSEYRSRVQGERASARLLDLVDYLFSQPLLTIKQVSLALEVNYSMAQRYVAQLEKFAILREITGQARNRAYRADAVLDAIEIR